MISLPGLALAFFAFESTPQDASIESFVTITGTCTNVAVLGDRPTGLCRGRIVNTTYTNGRSNFLFTLDGLAGLSFSGAGDRQVRNGDAVSQPIDRVILIFDDDPNQPAIASAVGRCTYANPYAGPMTIHCEADTASGRIEATFQTDGSAPDVEEF